MIEKVEWVRFQDLQDERGRLTAVESCEHIPFDIARVFFVHSVMPGADRGGHAHRDTDQVLSCIGGRMRVDVSDGLDKKTFVLDDPATGLFVPRMLWVRLYDFEDRAILSVYANTLYDRSRSIRTWEDFLKARGLEGHSEPGSDSIPVHGSIEGSPARSKAFSRAEEVLSSALGDVSDGFVDEVKGWLESRCAAANFSVERKPIGELEGWLIDPSSGNVVHKSGKFFQVIGVDVETNFGSTPSWSQPIINQPEIGILGFLTQKIDGELRFLCQAKMEPGNVNLVQISPTLQATRSNFTQVHGGKRPPYLEHFLQCGLDRVLVDQLQSEQGARFLRKRNRNIIIRVPDEANVPVQDGFMWLTLAQIQKLLELDNLVNMDARTVLSGIPYQVAWNLLAPAAGGPGESSFHEDVLRSLCAVDQDSLHDLTTVINWFAAMKQQYELRIRKLDLNQISEWICDGDTVHHSSGRYFTVIGVTVTASTREVVSWDQPMIESAKGGVICFLCQKCHGTLHFLVQARVEPGNFDDVELAPTLQFTPANYDKPESDVMPAFSDVFLSLRGDQIHYDSLQSEEGGRFYHDQNRYVVGEADPDQLGEIPDNYFWLTLGQIKELVRFNNCFNIEARSLLACIGLGR